MKTVLVALLILILTSCNNKVKETAFPLSPFTEVSLDSGKFTEFSVLKTYPAMKSCYPGKSYSNLYICKRNLTNDTVYIFESCESVDDLAFDSSDTYPLVLTEGSLQHHYDTVNIFVPDSFKMARQTKFLFAKVSFLTES